MGARELSSVIETLGSWEAPSYLLLYPEELQLSTVFQTIRERFPEATVVDTEGVPAGGISPTGSGPHIVPLLDFPDAAAPNESTDQALKSLCETSKTLFVAPIWFEICLRHPSSPRWVTRIETLRPSDTEAIEDTIPKFDPKLALHDRNQRRILYYYMEHRQFRSAVKAAYRGASTRIEICIEKNALDSLPNDVKKLLPESNNRLYRSLAAIKLREQNELQLAEFRQMYGDIRQINASPVNTPLVETILDGISREIPLPPFELTDIRLLTSQLYRTEETEEVIRQVATDLIEGNISHIDMGENNTNMIRKVASRCRLFTNIASNPTVCDFYRSLPALILTQQITEAPATDDVLDIIDIYAKIENHEAKSPITNLLTEGYRGGKFDELYNVHRVADFLEEPGPKLVLVIDSLGLLEESVRNLIRNQADIEPGYAVSPAHSTTDTFVNELRDQVDFSNLGGYIEGTGLKSQSVRSFVNQNEDRDELQNRLNAGESIILYDARLDVSARYENSRAREVEDYVRTITRFISRFNSMADIMVTSDHGMVETFPEDVIERHVTGDSSSHTTHNRGVITSSPPSNLSNIGSIEIEQTGSNGSETMITPLNPHSRIGTQTENIWTHGGISVEESLIPCFIVTA
ncbi:hypothetical protein OB919_08055 [Halobacteria archaeon AArc-curdl1]|uniref:PglZ domain-containing protein n=1 Tax=Natronosalvus hydrolyticus TaxID=2979988 RepID=A0AAP2Z8E6_9EURY|nr:hypothetical protein [Halobacteria archaeon AArc-curdl1]